MESLFFLHYSAFDEGDESLLQESRSVLRWAGKPQPYWSSQCFSWVPVLWREATICCSNHQSEGRGLSFFCDLSLLNCLITACGSYYQYIVDIVQFPVHKFFANNMELCKFDNTLWSCLNSSEVQGSDCGRRKLCEHLTQQSSPKLILNRSSMS